MPTTAEDGPLEARWILNELAATAAKVHQAFENYRFDDAANAIYQFFWGSFCDWYLEIVKLRLDFSDAANKAEAKVALTTLVQVFEAALRLLSPFMPFLTEELWHALHQGDPPAKSIALASFPRPKETSNSVVPAVNAEMNLLQSLIVEVRALRKEIGVEEKAILPIEVRTDGVLEKLADENRDIIERLARVSEVRFVEQITAGLAKHTTPSFDVAIVYERKIDAAAQRVKLNRDIAKLEKEIASLERQLSNPGFTEKAPAQVVERLQKQLAEKRSLFEKLGRDLDGLPPA